MPQVALLPRHFRACSGVGQLLVLMDPGTMRSGTNVSGAVRAE